MSRDQVWCPVCLEFHPHVRQDEFDELMAASSKLDRYRAALEEIVRGDTFGTFSDSQCVEIAQEALKP